MDLPSKYLEKAVEQMASLPGIGKRTALRLVLHLLNRDKEEVNRFSEALIALAEHVKRCKSCGNISDEDLCSICLDPKRNDEVICVVEDIRDILAIEETGSFNGKYVVLGGVISPIDGVGPSDLNIPLLLSKVQNGAVKEIILALSATMEGDTTNFYLYKKLHAYNVLITSLSRGVAVGSELHYTDGLSLSRSIQQRIPYSVST